MAFEQTGARRRGKLLVAVGIPTAERQVAAAEREIVVGELAGTRLGNPGSQDEAAVLLGDPAERQGVVAPRTEAEANGAAPLEGLAEVGRQRVGRQPGAEPGLRKENEAAEAHRQRAWRAGFHRHGLARLRGAVLEGLRELRMVKDDGGSGAEAAEGRIEELARLVPLALPVGRECPGHDDPRLQLVEVPGDIDAELRCFL
jgi:hypothetical protein